MDVELHWTGGLVEPHILSRPVQRYDLQGDYPRLVEKLRLWGAEGLSAARLFAGKGGYPIDTDQELLASGAANISSGLFGGIGVAGSLQFSGCPAQLVLPAVTGHPGHGRRHAPPPRRAHPSSPHSSGTRITARAVIVVGMMSSIRAAGSSAGQNSTCPPERSSLACHSPCRPR